MIYGDRIRFRHAEREDLPTFIEWLNDPEVRHGIALYLPMSMAEEEDWFEGMVKRPQDERTLCIEIQDGKDWKLIGNCGFFNFEQRPHSAELGILIGDKSQWNKGFGTEAMQLLLKHSFETLNLNRVFLRVFSNNPRAIRTYEKSGFEHEGRMRQAHYQDGDYHDVLIMGVLRSEWQEAQNK